MSAISAVKDGVCSWSDNTLSFMECCYCRESLCDPVMLDCLHNCCRSCLESSDAGSQKVKSTLTCPVCSGATEPEAIVANSFLCSHKRLSALYTDTVACSTCDALPEAAEFWCADCNMGLCASCYAWHNKFNRRHRSAEVDVARTWSFSQLAPAGHCKLHKRQLEVQCFTCRQPQCILCCKSCRAGKHDLKPLSHHATQSRITTVSDAIRGSAERLGRQFSGIQQKSRSIANGIQQARKNSERTLLRHKRLLQDSANFAFERSLTEVYVNLHRVLCECCHVMARRSSLSETATCAARHVEMLSSTGFCSVHLFRERRVLKAIVLWYSSSCKASPRRLLQRVQKSGTFVVDSSMPLTADIMLSACLGAADRRRAAPAAPLLFGHVSRGFRTSVNCTDLAVTRDGQVLLAAGKHGLLVYTDRGQQLSSWRPTRQSNGKDEEVLCVAVLNDGRAAVGVHIAQLVMLLRRNSETGDTWLEDRRLAVLQSPPRHLAVHDDLLAVITLRLDEQQWRWERGRHVQLLRLSSEQLLYRLSTEYDIRSVALTALCVVTASHGSVKRNTGLRPHLVDAFSHAGDFLWRYETSDEEVVFGLCAAETWSRVYVIVIRSDLSSSRVMAIGGADGRDKTDVLSSMTHGLRYPVFLSLVRGQQRTVLAVLSDDVTTGRLKAVAVYEATTK